MSNRFSHPDAVIDVLDDVGVTVSDDIMPGVCADMSAGEEIIVVATAAIASEFALPAPLEESTLFC